MKILETGDIVIINDSVYKVTQLPNADCFRCRNCDCDNVCGCQSYLRKFIKNKVAILGTEIINNYYCHDIIGMKNILKKIPINELLISWEKYCRR